MNSTYLTRRYTNNAPRMAFAAVLCQHLIGQIPLRSSANEDRHHDRAIPNASAARAVAPDTILRSARDHQALRDTYLR